MEEHRGSDPCSAQPGDSTSKGISRRKFLQSAGIAGLTACAGAGIGGLLSGCGQEKAVVTTAGITPTTGAVTATSAAVSTTAASAGPEGGRDIKVGVVAPMTGPFAAFGVPEKWSLDKYAKAFKDGVIAGDGKRHNIVTILRDTQSDSNRSAQVTGDLIQNDKVDAVTSGGTPENVNPSADQCEAMGVPSISSHVPWQGFYYGRGATPDKPFKWTYAIALGVEQELSNFVEMWNSLPNNKMVGGLWPNNTDGIAWADPVSGAPPLIKEGGYTLVNPGLYPPGAEDFTSQITEYKKAGCEVMIATTSPPDFANFWKQCIQQGFHPVATTASLAFLFPESVYAVGDIAIGCNVELLWHPTYPFKSSLSGETCRQLADDYEAWGGQQWTPAIPLYSRMEWLVDALKRTPDIDDKAALAQALATTKMETVWGPIDMTTPPQVGTDHPVPNCCRPRICGGQWVKGTKWPYEVIVVSNVGASEVPVQGTIKPIEYRS